MFLPVPISIFEYTAFSAARTVHSSAHHRSHVTTALFVIPEL
jgi:hypothetical protein